MRVSDLKWLPEQFTDLRASCGISAAILDQRLTAMDKNGGVMKFAEGHRIAPN